MRSAIVVLALAACREGAPLPEMDDPLALLARPTADGSVLDVSAYQGKVVLITFWSPG